MISKRRA